MPSRVRLAWAGSYDVNESWQIRVNFLTGYRIGPASDPVALLEVRAAVNRRITNKIQLGLDYFGNMNDTEAFGNWEAQRHQAGPSLTAALSKNMTVIGSVLFSVSRAASDSEYRAFVMHSF